MESTADPLAQADAIARHMVEGNELALLEGGEERLKALIELIESAERQLDIYFYIFTRDECGQRVVEALIDARNRGVGVTLIVDAFGSALTPQSFFAPLVDAGVRFGVFGARRSTRYLIRNHQKMVIADSKRVLVGGFNCDKLYFGSRTEALAWCDLGLLVEGPLAAELQRWYDALEQWTMDGQTFRALRRLVRIWRPGEGKVSWLIGGPTRNLNSWTRKVKGDLQTGRRLDLVAAYFSPSRGMMRRINGIARRGFARLVTPAKSDNTATIGAQRYLYHRLLRAGVRIFEYQPQKLHMKLIVIDDIVYIGSANFDMRSLFINLELMLRIQDQRFADEARALVDRLTEQSKAIDEPAYEAMSGFFWKILWWLDYQLVAVLDYTVTRRLNFRRQRQ